MSKEQAVDYLLSRSRTSPINSEPKWMEGQKKIMRLMISIRRSKEKKDKLKLAKEVEIETKKLFNQFPNIPGKLAEQLKTSTKDPKALLKSLRMFNNRVLSKALQAWWLEEIFYSPSPLSEKMTLFWHNHFATSMEKVRTLSHMYNQNLLLRKHALGNFSDLLFSISKDAAMLRYLDGNANKKSAPNENFAREVMELFTLGEGHYSEKDIRESARAFTGWNFDRIEGNYIFNRRQHDFGEKTFLGKKGNFKGDDILKILLEQKQTAIFITTKLWKEFVNLEPNQKVIEKWATKFYTSNYDIKTLMRIILTSNEFYSSKNKLIKSPIEFVIGSLKQFDIEPEVFWPFALSTQRLGQAPFAPPNVKGWIGGKNWINSATLISRKDYLNRLLRLGEKKMANSMKMSAMKNKFDYSKWASQYGTWEETTQILIGSTPLRPIKFRKKNPTASLKNLISDPQFQLK